MTADGCGMSGAELITAERQRQLDVEGWGADHDDEHADGSLTKAAIVYASIGTSVSGLRAWWPWDAKWFKPSPDRVRNLTKAGALIAAEIDRLERAASMTRDGR